MSSSPTTTGGRASTHESSAPPTPPTSTSPAPLPPATTTTTSTTTTSPTNTTPIALRQVRVLEPGDGEIFPFQVSGHDLMLRTRRGNVVKVATEREVRFYERVAETTPRLLPFVPKYYGILAFRDGSDDLRQTVKRQVESINVNELNLSPWTFQVLKKELSRKKPDSEHILISDLTRGFVRPNVVDIKLGTLHHSQARAQLKPTKYGTAISLGYCVAEGTPVDLADGTACPIERLDALRGAALASPSPARLALEFARCSAAFASGVKPCVRVTLADGRALVCTPDHRLLTADGAFVTAGQLVVGRSALAVSPLASPCVMQLAGDARALAFARLAGRVQASGCSDGDGVVLAPASELDRDAMLRDVAALQLDADVLQVRPLLRLRAASGAVRAMRSWAVHDAPLAVAREFLGAVCGAATSAQFSDAGSVELACAAEPAWLAQCGVPARRTAAGAVAVECEAFCERVGFRYATALQRRASALCIARRVAARGGGSVAECLSAIGFSGAGDDKAAPALLRLAVVGVECAGARRVFDLTVPGNATFVAGGVCVHNCIGGMMVWNNETSSYSHIDKYVGRKLTDATIGGVLELFFAPAGRILIKALLPAIHKLRLLLALFDEQTAWRFHSTSLLIIYEGARQVAAAHGTESRVSVALVDFAHAYMNHPGVEGRTPQVDAGCRLGISNVIALCEKMALRSSLHIERSAEWSSTVKWRSLPSSDCDVMASSDHEDAKTEPSSGEDALNSDDDGGDDSSDAISSDRDQMSHSDPRVRTGVATVLVDEPRRSQSVSDFGARYERRRLQARKAALPHWDAAISAMTAAELPAVAAGDVEPLLLAEPAAAAPAASDAPATATAPPTTTTGTTPSAKEKRRSKQLEAP